MAQQNPYDWEEIKQHLATLPNTLSKIEFLMQRKQEYENDLFAFAKYSNFLERPFVGKCNSAIQDYQKLYEIEHRAGQKKEVPKKAGESKQTYKSILVALQVIGTDEHSETGKRIVDKYAPAKDESSYEDEKKRKATIKKRIDEAKRRLGRNLDKYFTPDNRKGYKHNGAKKAILNAADYLLSAEIISGQIPEISDKCERGIKKLQSLLQRFTNNNR